MAISPFISGTLDPRSVTVVRTVNCTRCHWPWRPQLRSSELLDERGNESTIAFCSTEVLTVILFAFCLSICVCADQYYRAKIRSGTRCCGDMVVWLPFFSTPSTENVSDGFIESNEDDTLVRVLDSMEPCVRTHVRKKCWFSTSTGIWLKYDPLLAFPLLLYHSVLTMIPPLTQLPIFVMPFNFRMSLSRFDLYYDLLSYFSFVLFSFLFLFRSHLAPGFNPQNRRNGSCIARKSNSGRWLWSDGPFDVVLLSHLSTSVITTTTTTTTEIHVDCVHKTYTNALGVLPDPMVFSL